VNPPIDAKAAQAFMEYVWADRFDWTNQHYEGTPRRFMTMLQELTTPKEYEFTTFNSVTDEMVVIKDINFVSLCAHHIIPFMGTCSIGYVPRGKIAGLSKFARLVRYHAADLMVQEELTYEIGRDLELKLDRPQGVAVVMEAEHLCMSIRGVQSPGTKTVTSYMSGVFADHARQARNEFLAFLKG
jgi:GTP cyclohydrolase I